MKIVKKWYICLNSCKYGALTKGKKYQIWQTAQNKKNDMFTINHYDDEDSPGPLNSYWAKHEFKPTTFELNNNVKIL
jgi:hypothetical protein